MAFTAINKVAIAGVGHSKIGRRLDRPLGLLALDASLNAIADAGLEVADIDGLATYPQLPATGHGAQRDGHDVVSVGWMVQALGARTVSWWLQVGTGNIGTAIGQAVQAIATGCCDHALVWRALHMPRTGGYTQHTGNTAEGALAYTAPYGATFAPLAFAPTYNRYLKLYGARRRHLGTYVVSARRYANLTPHAYFANKPMTMDDYLASPMVADPMCVLDCDIPVDGAAALVLTSAERARDLRHPPAYITGLGQSGWDAHLEDPLEKYWHIAQSLGTGLWASSGLTPSDMDGAMLYDGFAPDIYFWLEGLGFCGRGEAYEWIQDGRLDLDGGLPINTFGGCLSEGRLHGIGHWIEAAMQVQRRAGQRQIANAEHIVVATGLTGRGTGAIVSAGPRLTAGADLRRSS